MGLKAASLVAARFAAFFLLAACGGGKDDGIGAAPGTGGVSNNGNGSPRAQYVAVDLQSPQKTQTYGFGIADGEQVGLAASVDTGYRAVAVLWRGSASSLVSLHPNGFISSAATATSGGMQAGWGYMPGGRQHALKWAGSSDTAVDLDPDGFWSQATAISGEQVVGWGAQGGNAGPSHALLWNSRDVVDLHPAGFSQSNAFATDGVQQVGGGISNGDNSRAHALLWMGAADKVVDLHPLGGYVVWSVALGVSGGQQVGAGINSLAGPGINSWGSWHALLWTGSAQSVVDLHPSGFRESSAVAVAAGRQVGHGTMADGSSRALLWNGTAGSVVDLHVFLPPGFGSSQATGIDSSGNVIGNADGRAILWVRQ
jgi:hypothetical protein